MVHRFGRVLLVVGVVVGLVLSASACSSHSASTGGAPVTGSGPSQTPEARAAELVAQARTELGADFDDGQISCMATYAVAHPVLLESGAGADPAATTSPEPSKELMAMVLGCVPRDQFVGYLVKSLGEPSDGSPPLTPAEQTCVSAGLATLSADQLASMTSDPSAQASLIGAVTPCLLGATSTTAAGATSP